MPALASSPAQFWSLSSLSRGGGVGLGWWWKWNAELLQTATWQRPTRAIMMIAMTDVASFDQPTLTQAHIHPQEEEPHHDDDKAALLLWPCPCGRPLPPDHGGFPTPTTAVVITSSIVFHPAGRRVLLVHHGPAQEPYRHLPGPVWHCRRLCRYAGVDVCRYGWSYHSRCPSYSICSTQHTFVRMQRPAFSCLLLSTKSIHPMICPPPPLPSSLSNTQR